MELPEWTGRARRVERPVLEVGFVVWEDFRHPSGLEGPAGPREPLRQPALTLFHRHVNYALTPALEGNTGELVPHYRDVLRVAEKHGIPAPRPHFWMSPFILFQDGTVIPFSEDETREYAEHVLAALEASTDGEIFHGDEQGWEVSVVAAGDRLYIRHTTHEMGEEVACVRCDRGELVRQIAPLRARLSATLAELERALGPGYWSDAPDPAGLA